LLFVKNPGDINGFFSFKKAFFTSSLDIIIFANFVEKYNSHSLQPREFPCRRLLCAAGVWDYPNYALINPPFCGDKTFTEKR
jgi:hypothetical protein